MQTQWLALFLHDRVNNYQLLLREDAEKAARRYSHNLVVHSADRSADTQVKQIRSVLTSSKNNPPTGILVSPVLESSLIGVMAEAAGQRIPWVYLCRWSETVHAVRRDHPGLSVFSVAADQTQIGRLQGRVLACQIADKHELVYIQGPQGVSSVSRRKAALQRELECFPKLRWADYNSDWSTEGGASVMRSWLANFKRGQLPAFAICAQNDDMAWGARMALVESGHISRNNKPIIVGCDGLTTFGQRLVSEGTLTATVIVPSVSGRAIDELFRALAMKLTVPAEVSIDVIVYPSLEQLTKGVSIYEKLICRSRAAPLTSTTPPSLAPSRTSASLKLDKAKQAAASAEADRLFAATLREVAESSRQAAASRSVSVPPPTSPDPEQSGASGTGRRRTDPRG